MSEASDVVASAQGQVPLYGAAVGLAVELSYLLEGSRVTSKVGLFCAVSPLL